MQLPVVVTGPLREATQCCLVRPPRPPEDIEDRQRDRDRDALQDAKQRNPEKRDEREQELDPALAPQPDRSRQVGERQRGCDHDGGECGVWEVLQQPGHEHEHQDDRGRSDHAGQLGLRTGLLGDRGPRSAGADRESLEEAGGNVGGPDADHLAVAVDLLPGASGKRRGCRDRVGERDERDPRRSRYQQRKIRNRAGYGQRRKPLRQLPDERDAMVSETKHGRCRDRGDHRNQDAGDPRQPAADRQDHREADQSDRDGGADGIARGEPVHESSDLVDEPIRVHGEPEQFRELSDQDRQRKAVHVADPRRLGEQISDEPELRDPRRDHDRPDDQREHGRQRDGALRTPVRPDDREDRRRDHGTQRRIRTEHENS